MAKIDKVQEVAIEKLKPYERNAKIHTEEQIRKIVESIKEFGFISPCIIDSEYNLIAGHGRVEASKVLGMDTVPCLFVEGLTDEQRRAYILADNKLTEMGKWDKSLVSLELEELRDAGFDINLTGFNIDNILFEDVDLENEPEEIDIEEASKTVEHRVKKGEIWQLGRHRLMCGDSTKQEDVKKLMNNELADLLLTDPPYNVNIGVLNQKKLEAFSEFYKGANTDELENDNMEPREFYEFLLGAMTNAYDNMKEGAPFYVWCGCTAYIEFITALQDAGLPIHEHLVWVKNSISLGFSDYQWRHESCLYGWKDGASHYFINLRTQATTLNMKNIDNLTYDELKEAYKKLASTSTAIYEERPNANKVHPTMKPVGLIKKLVRNSSKENELVLDLFGGSGTTIIACEEMNRRCNMMEFDEKYASVIVDRWEELTGEKACKLEEK